MKSRIIKEKNPMGINYDRRAADAHFKKNEGCYLYLTREEHNALIRLCEIRNTMIKNPYALFDTGNPHHREFVSYIRDKALGTMLFEAGLPFLNLEYREDYIIEDTVFAESYSAEFTYKKSGRKEILFRDDAENIDAETIFCVIKEIQKYLYNIDTSYGTKYMALGNPDLTFAEKWFVDSVKNECYIEERLTDMYEEQLSYFCSETH